MSFLELQDVCVGFGSPDQRTEVLSEINLSVEENEFVAVIGFSGSGKSTLMSLLAGLIQPDEGKVIFEGQEKSEPGPDRGDCLSKLLASPLVDLLRQHRTCSETSLSSDESSGTRGIHSQVSLTC